MPVQVAYRRGAGGRFVPGKQIRPPRVQCRNGHDLTPENTYTHTSGEGYTYRGCRSCKNATSTRHNRKIKFETFAQYGRVCACCEEDRQEFLAIDHINGGGKRHFQELGKSGTGFYTWLKKQGYPDGYRVLCHNCNQSLGNFGYCPHG